MTDTIEFPPCFSADGPRYSIPALLRKFPVACVTLASYHNGHPDLGEPIRDRYVVNPWRDPSWSTRNDGLLVLAFRQDQIFMMDDSGNSVDMLARSRPTLELLQAMGPGDSIEIILADNWRHNAWFREQKRHATHFFGIPL